MLKLSEAKSLCDLVLAYGRKLNCQPLTVVVLDRGGHLLSAMREEEAGILRFEIARGKAWGALGMGFGTSTFARLTDQPGTMNSFVTALMAASEGKVIPTKGGVLIRNEAGSLIGAIGVSGDIPDRDEECILYALKESKLIAQT